MNGDMKIPSSPILTALLLLSPVARSQSVTLRFAGDCLLASHYEYAAARDPGLAFEGFTLLKDADMAMVNLECPVTTRGTKVEKPFNFRMNPRFLSPLVEAGIDVVNIANNHIYDYGREGLFDTISYLDSVGIRHVGAGRNVDEARRPVIYSAGGKRIGILGYYGGGEAPPAIVAADIRALRTKDSVDFVVVNLHWGTEKESVPDGAQRAFAHAVIDAGADAVIGHHPHVLQGIELYRKGIIVYSLGNFVFGGNGRDTYDTGVFEIRLTTGATSYRFIPVGIRGWKALALEGEQSERVMGKVRRLSSVFPHSIFTR
jgi:poly-gamma-glutamate synthesis protein (capsule biosynthesis protein)